MLWKIIYQKLKSDSIPVYLPGQHQGDCISPYVVTKPMGSSQFQGYSTDVMYCEVLCYVPRDHFSMIDDFVSQVKSCLKEMYPQVKESHVEVTGFFDDSNKSYMWSIQYQSYRQFFNLS